MRKGDDAEKKNGVEKIMMRIVATNVVASRPPERRPTGTTTARANTECHYYSYRTAQLSPKVLLQEVMCGILHSTLSWGEVTHITQNYILVTLGVHTDK